VQLIYTKIHKFNTFSTLVHVLVTQAKSEELKLRPKSGRFQRDAISSVNFLHWLAALT